MEKRGGCSSFRHLPPSEISIEWVLINPLVTVCLAVSSVEIVWGMTHVKAQPEGSLSDCIS